MRSNPRVLAFVSVAQAFLFGALTLMTFAVFGLALLFGVADAPAGSAGRSEVASALVELAVVVVIPALLTVLFAVAAARATRSPRAAAVVLLVAEPAGVLFLLWPALRVYFFQLPPSTAVAIGALALTVPALVVATYALASSGAEAGLPDRRRASAAPPAARRH